MSIVRHALNKSPIFSHQKFFAPTLIAVAATMLMPATADEIHLDLNGDIRYRFEHVEKSKFDKDANGNSLRLRLSGGADLYEWASILVEGEHISHLGAFRAYDTVNGLTDFPKIADPEATELNRAQLELRWSDRATITIGRQRIIHDNARFIGNVGFRQNEQTYDGVRVAACPELKFCIDYAYIGKVHRIFGDQSQLGEFEGTSHVAHAFLDVSNKTQFSPYLYFLDLGDASTSSTATIGGRLKNEFSLRHHSELMVAFEGARQSAYGDNPQPRSLGYVAGEITFHHSNYVIEAAYEHLGGDGLSGFATPLATLHAFQGFADLFLTPPPDGLRDIHAAIEFEIPTHDLFSEAKAELLLHHFTSIKNARTFGDEIDFAIHTKLSKEMAMDLTIAKFFSSTYEKPDVFEIAISIGYVF